MPVVQVLRSRLQVVKTLQTITWCMKLQTQISILIGFVLGSGMEAMGVSQTLD